MKISVLLFFLLIALNCLAGGNDDYAVSRIKSSLMQNADVIVRKEETRFEYKSSDKAVEYYKIVLTVLNENGDKYSSLALPYDKFTSIDFIEGSMYDASGKKIKSLKRNEIADKSGNNQFADDTRYKEHSFYNKVYPYTVEYEYTLIHKQTMFFPNWFPRVDENYAVEESSFSIIVPADYLLRYKAFNYSSEPGLQAQADKKIYSWSSRDLPAIKTKFGFPGWRYVSPMVITAPSDFQIEDYKGSMLSWEEMGKFQLALNKDRDQLPDELRQKVKQLTEGKTTEEKIYTLYSFLQKNTRYVSIQLGVGGWRPMEASAVAKYSYGDCKALSNYMTALLKEAGIRSYYTLIHAGRNEEDIVADFPSRQFNHAIVCVPLEKDTIWLECTSQDEVPGYLGSFTGNRHALLITENGGKLVETKYYSLAENLQIRKITAKLNEDGSLLFQSNTDYTGTQQETYHNVINTMLSKEKVNEFLQDQIDLATFEVLKFQYNQERTRIPRINEKLEVSISNYSQITGKRIFINPDILNRTNLKLSVEERNYPISLRNSFTDEDSVIINLPEGYKPESMPARTEIKSVFGNYVSEIRIEGNKIFYYRKIQRRNGLFGPETYADLVKFYDQVYKADRNKVVLVKN